jgi:hypothetical protein
VSPCQVVQEDTCVPVGWLCLHGGGQGRSSPTRIAPGQVLLTADLLAAPLRVPGVEVEEVPLTDERCPRRNPARDQRTDSNEEFRRRLERETDLSLRKDPERRRFYRSEDLPRSGSSSDDRPPAAMPHSGVDVLAWNGETLTLIGWSQRTGIWVETLLRRCRKGWSVEQVLTTPPGGGVAIPPA